MKKNVAESGVEIGTGKFDGGKSGAFIPDGQQHFLDRVFQQWFVVGKFSSIVIKSPEIKAVDGGIGFLVILADADPEFFVYLQKEMFWGNEYRNDEGNYKFE